MKVWQRLVWLTIRTMRPVPGAFRGRVAEACRMERRWWLLIGGAWVVAVIAGTVGVAWVVHERLWGSSPDTWRDVAEDVLGGDAFWYGVAWAAVLAVVTALVLCVLFMWQRQRLVRVLHRRELCARCGHGLAGLPVQDNGSVRCPECAAAVPVSEEWGEVSDSGTRTFAPATGLVRVFWTIAKVKRAGRMCAVVGGIAAVLYGSWWTVREVRIRREAEVAAKDRVPVADVEAALRAAGGQAAEAPVEGTTTFAADVVAAAHQSFRTRYDEYVSAHQGAFEDPNECNPDPNSVYGGSRDTPDRRENARLAALLIGDLENAGTFRSLESLAAATAVTARFTPIDAAAVTPPPSLGPHRQVARACAARAWLASDTGDLAKFTQSVRLCFRLTESSLSGGTLIHYLVAVSIDSMALRCMEHALDAHGEAEWLDAMQTLLAEHRTPALAPVLWGVRLSTLDSVAWYFSDPARVRAGMSAPDLKNKMGVGNEMFVLLSGLNGEEAPELRLGTYAENRAALVASFDRAEAAAEQEPWESIIRPGKDAPRSDLAIVDTMFSTYSLPGRTRAPSLLQRRTVEARLGLERYRLRHGVYPERLDALVPAILPAVPADPYVDAPLGYRRESTGLYTLWSVGVDGVDNGGLTPEGNPSAGLNAEGYDINVSRAREY